MAKNKMHTASLSLFSPEVGYVLFSTTNGKATLSEGLRSQLSTNWSDGLNNGSGQRDMVWPSEFTEWKTLFFEVLV